ncbi:MAG: pyridoxamine 5'-phosphate oxidase family protein [Propionibacteriales bacterium]|nr:pyridoxamine 5'-phosphate oxidase family protein [Propionibacteriales bacterium]
MRRELTEEESIRLLGSVSLGRIVFTDGALPAIRPVNHIIDGGDVIICTHEGAAVIPDAASGVVVCYEADSIDPISHLGWSVIVTGIAQLVLDPARAAHYRKAVRPWVSGSMAHVIRIRPELITGFELVDDAPSQNEQHIRNGAA